MRDPLQAGWVLLMKMGPYFPVLDGMVVTESVHLIKMHFYPLTQFQTHTPATGTLTEHTNHSHVSSASWTLNNVSQRLGGGGTLEKQFS